jgi:hypothetical protein
MAIATTTGSAIGCLPLPERFPTLMRRKWPKSIYPSSYSPSASVPFPTRSSEPPSIITMIIDRIRQKSSRGSKGLFSWRIVLILGSVRNSRVMSPTLEFKPFN